jgi:hypothetical protein
VRCFMSVSTAECLGGRWKLAFFDTRAQLFQDHDFLIGHIIRKDYVWRQQGLVRHI